MSRNFIRNTISWITDNCFLFFMVFSFMTFYFDIPGVLRQILWLLLFVMNLRYVRIENQMDKIVMFYFFASFLTLSGYIIMPYPLGDFIKVFIYSYIPIIFYFIGKHHYSSFTNFMSRSNLGIMFLILLGFYFLIFPTDTFITKSLETINIHGHYTEDTFWLARFASFMDSYHTANLGVCSLCFSFGLLKFSRLPHVKHPKLLRIVSLLFIMASVIAILLARQRVAIYIGALIFIYLLLSSGVSRKTIFFVIVPILIGCLWYLISSIGGMLIDQIIETFSREGSSTLISSRSNQWVEALEGFFIEPLLGLGIGSSGHVAFVNNPQHPIVTDGSYFKILVEGGIISFIPFMIILGFSFFRACRNRKIYYVELPLLFFFMCSLLGANIIDMPYIILFMWYVIGRINSNKKYVYE